MTRRVVIGSVIASFLLGMTFIFVWRPHPWGWYGIDQYHLLAIELAQGRGFPTLDVPWGYAYFLSVFYRLFGPTPVPPLLAQVALNALIPALVYSYARDNFGARVAAVACVLTATLSFNTVYASTESSDAVCTVLFMGGVGLFGKALLDNSWKKFAASGALFGLAAQFRPNLLLVPVLVAVLAVVWGARAPHRARHAALVVVCAAATLVPWTIRNFRLTGEMIPTSTHGGVQLWYGSLQTGPYLDGFQYNPRRVFEASAFPYSSLLNASIVVEGTPRCDNGKAPSITLVYWTDADATPRRIALAPVREMPAGTRFAGTIPAQFAPRTVFYYFDVTWRTVQGDRQQRFTPEAGPADPFVYLLGTNHLGDLDPHDALLDVFDVARLLQHIAWGEPVRGAAKFDFDRNGRLDESDLGTAVGIMLSSVTKPGKHDLKSLTVAVSPTAVRATFADGSEFTVPRDWNGVLTDLQIGEGHASALLHGFSSFVPRGRPGYLRGLPCDGVIDVAANEPFYRAQPHEMRRYTALAWDNIRRDPRAYAAMLYRAARLFVVRGTEDRNTAVQFSRSSLVYRAAFAASAVYFLLFVAGVFVAWRRRAPVAFPLILILYVPATIAFVLTNMRYTVTVQPLLFIFNAVSLLAIAERLGMVRSHSQP